MAYGNPTDHGSLIEVEKVVSDVMKNPGLTARARKESLHPIKKKRPKGFKASMRDAGDALAAARF